MSRYTDLRDEAKTDRYSPPDDLHYALERAGNDVQRLWNATNQLNDYYGCRYYCPACGESNDNHAEDCPHEALRWLFEDND